MFVANLSLLIASHICVSCQTGVGEGLSEQRAAGPPMGRQLPAAQPMAPVPGIGDEGNVYRPLQEGREKPFTYMDRVQERKQVEEVREKLRSLRIIGRTFDFSFFFFFHRVCWLG